MELHKIKVQKEWIDLKANEGYLKLTARASDFASMKMILQ